MNNIWFSLVLYITIWIIYIFSPEHNIGVDVRI